MVARTWCLHTEILAKYGYIIGICRTHTTRYLFVNNCDYNIRTTERNMKDKTKIYVYYSNNINNKKKNIGFYLVLLHRAFVGALV